MVSSAIYEKVTYEQIENMKHAIGFERGRIRGTKHRRYEPYRNYYDAGPAAVDSWEQLVEIGFATKFSPLGTRNCYFVSDDGREFLRMVTGVEILPESR